MRDGVEDVFYRPPDEGLGWLRTIAPERCLVLGVPTEQVLQEVAKLAAELRTTSADRWDKVFHTGSYAARIDGEWWAMVVPSALQAASPDQERDRFAEGHLGTAIATLPLLWPNATPHSGSSEFSVNDVVRPRGERRFGRVRKVVPRPHGHDIYVLLDGAERQFSEAALEKVEGDPLDPDFWVKESPASAEDIAFTLTWTKLRHPLTDTLYSYASSKTVFRAYQFVPVLKLLSSSTGRLLIADEVGLGKTIEAGLIWSELEQRTRLDRVLVVAPASLTLKWVAEMQRRFDRALKVLSAADLEEFARQISDGQEPSLQGVVSIQAMRGAKGALELLNEVNPQLDLVVVDEAHAMRNRATSTHLLGQMLSDWSDYLLFLSATPLNLGQDDLFNLVNLLSEEEFGDRAIFASQLRPNQVLTEVARELVGDGSARPRALVHRLDAIHEMELGRAVTQRPDFATLRDLLNRDSPLTHAEIAMAKRLIAELNTLSSVFTRTRKADVPDAKAVREAIEVNVDWTDEEYQFYLGVQRAYMRRVRESGVPPGFAMQMPLRQAASCIPAMQELMREKNPELLLGEVEDVDDEFGPTSAFDWEDLPDLGRPLQRDSKFEALRERLLQARGKDMRQAMVFSFFRRTLTYLAERLSEDFSVRVMTGRTKMADRQVIMEDFRAGKFELLLLSQVGSEGLDFEFCNVLVNYDLPWNPMQVEQRIGRLDRFGQQHPKIFIFNMHVPGTIETEIFERLYRRIGVFEESIGELEPILRDDFSAMTRQILDPELTPEQRQRKTELVAQAIEKRKEDIKRLGEAHGLLSSIDQLKIDGMTEAGPSDGRFIGQSEVRRLLDRLLDRMGGRLSAPDSSAICKLVGSATLAQRLRAGGIPARGSMYSTAKLAAMLRDEEVIPVTFETEVASRHNVELLSSRHPLVALALDEFGRESLTLKRYGAVRVPGFPRAKRYVARVDLAESTGLRPRVELWVTAVELETGVADDEVVAKLLTALAEGSLTDISGPLPDIPSARLREVSDLVSVRREATERRRLEENVALVEARIASRRSSIQLKIDRAERMRQEAIRDRKDPGIIRLHEGRRRNLLNDARAIADDLEPKKHLSLSLTQVAVLLVEGFANA